MTIDFTPDTLAKMQSRAAQHVAVRKFNTRECSLASTIATGLGGASPITTQGDLIVGNSSGMEARLAIGASGTVLKSNGTTAAWATYPGHGNILSLSSAVGTVTIPANTLAAGDFVEAWAGETTDGSSVAATIELDLDATSLATASDANTAAHQWSLSARLYYTGTNLVTVSASVSSSASPGNSFSGASTVASAASSHTISVKTDAHATKGALILNVYRP